MNLEEWLDSKVKEYENDLDFQRERLLYLLGERLAERLEHAYQVGREWTQFFKEYERKLKDGEQND